jgi:hypothetical protein
MVKEIIKNIFLMILAVVAPVVLCLTIFLTTIIVSDYKCINSVEESGYTREDAADICL